MRNIVSGIIETIRFAALDFRDAASRYFSLGIGGSMPGLFIKVPFTPLSAWVEWGTPHAGFGTAQSTEGNLEFFLGTVRGVLSIEPKIERAEAL